MPKRRTWSPFKNREVESVFDRYPEGVWEKMMQLRELIFDTAEATEGIGELQEALRWGEPSYLTSKPKSGTTIRIDSKSPDQFAVYVHCQTDLIARFKTLYPEKFRYGGTRSISMNVGEELPQTELARFLSMALTYHLKPRSKK